MTQEEFWKFVGPIFILSVGFLMLYASYKYNKNEHEKMDWENQYWAGTLSKEILSELPWWVLRVIFAIIGSGLITLSLYFIIFK